MRLPHRGGDSQEEKQTKQPLPDRSRQGSKRERATAWTNKGRRTRRFPVHEDLAKALGTIKRRKDGRIFHGPKGGVLKPDTVRNVLIREVLPLLKRRFPKDGDEPGFENGRVYCLKHYFVSRYANDQVPVQLLKAWLWCKNSKRIDRYYHPDDDVASRHMNSIKFVTDDDATTYSRSLRSTFARRTPGPNGNDIRRVRHTFGTVDCAKDKALIKH